MIRKLGASLRAMMTTAPLEGCPYCGLVLEEGVYHEFDAETRTWRCKTILEPRGGDGS